MPLISSKPGLPWLYIVFLVINSLCSALVQNFVLYFNFSCAILMPFNLTQNYYNVFWGLTSAVIGICFCVFSVLSPEKVSRMEHVLPIWTTSWSSKSAKQIHMQVHLGVRVSSLIHSELWVLKSIHLINFTWSFHYGSGFLLDYLSKKQEFGFSLPYRIICCSKNSNVLLAFLQQFY